MGGGGGRWEEVEEWTWEEVEKWTWVGDLYDYDYDCCFFLKEARLCAWTGVRQGIDGICRKKFYHEKEHE